MSDLTLTEFILQGIAEDEEVARRARDENPTLLWEAEKVYDGVYSIDLGPSTHIQSDSLGVGEDLRVPREMAQHVARHKPARVLAECEAKRRIVEEATGQHTSSDEGYSILRIMATVYADHPDYREEWKP